MQTNDIRRILDLIREKDPAGFELLYQHYFRFLFSVAYSVLNNEEDCYDVVQSVMMRLYMLDETLFPTGHELGWLKTVVKNEALMRLRKEKATVPLEETAELPVQDQRIDDFVDMEEFRSLTAALNERQRKVVTMKIMGDLTHKEISKILSVPIGTVQWLYNSSIKELRRVMTTLTVFVLIFDGGMGYELFRYFRPAEAPGQIGIESIPPVEPALSPWLPVSVVLFLTAVLAWVLFFKFSDRLPTKCDSKCI